MAQKLKNNEPVEPEHFNSTSILYSDLVNFTQFSDRAEPRAVLDMLNQLFTRFDKVVSKYDAFMVDIIGDACKCVLTYFIVDKTTEV